METACRLPDDETQWSLLRQTESCWRAVRVFQGAGHPGSYTEIDCKLPDSCDKLLRSLSKLRGPLAGCHAVFGAAWPGFYGDCRLPDGCDNVPWSSSKLRGPLAGCNAVSGAAWPVSMETADCPTTRPCGLC